MRRRTIAVDLDCSFDRLREEFVEDDRAIEGLPIRLVIALVVGVAALSVMMNMISSVDGLAVSELDAAPQPEVVNPGSQNVSVQVVDSDGAPVAGATIVVSGESASLSAVQTATTNETGVATVAIEPTLGQNQDRGTVTIDIKPPAGSEYVDRRGNTDVLVVKN